jgi:hypothetical protein
MTVTLSLDKIQDMTHDQLIAKLKAGIADAAGVGANKVVVKITDLTVSGKYGGFPEGPLDHNGIITAIAEMMSLAKSVVTINYGGKTWKHGQTGGLERRLAQSVGYSANIVNGDDNNGVATMQQAMKGISADNLKKGMAAAGIDTSTMSLTEEAAPVVAVKTESVVTSDQVPDVAAIASSVDKETGGTTFVTAVNDVAATTITTTITATTTAAENPETDWAITPMISIWSVLYAMALS